jgi:hypothetical protein
MCAASSVEASGGKLNYDPAKDGAPVAPKPYAGRSGWDPGTKGYEADLATYRAYQQAEADKLAAERQAAIASNLAKAQELQQQQAAVEADQRAQAADLQAQQEAASMRIGQMKDAADSVTNSMRVLSQGSDATKAPAAALTKLTAVRRGGAANNASALRIGSTGRKPGVGTNLGV